MTQILFSKLSVTNCTSFSLTLSRFFTDNLPWITSLEKGLKEIRQTKKFGVLVIHRSTCGACQNLKKNMKVSRETAKKSKSFVFISLDDSEAPRIREYAPDGAYVPRILFIAPTGQVLREVTNPESSDEHKYFYSDVDPLLKNMERLLKDFK